MKTKTHTGSVIIILQGDISFPNSYVLLGHKPLFRKGDEKRKRKRVGCGLWMPPGGERTSKDKSQVHGAQREARQETGILFPLRSFQKAGVLRGYISRAKILEWIVHIYLVSVSPDNAIKPVSNDEYDKMKWFRLDQLPFDSMLKGDRHWMPRICKGEKLSIKMFFGASIGDLLSHEVKSIRSFN